MTRRPAATGGIPPIARLLGLSGLLPQLAAVALLLNGDPQSRFSALAIAYAYAAIILSFLGGLWWASPHAPTRRRAGSGSQASPPR